MGGEWPRVRVGELADSISDTHRLEKEKLIFVNTSDVLLGKILHHSYSAVRKWPGQAKKSIKRDDILFSEIRPANGRWAFVDVDADDYVVSTKLMVIRARASRILPRYLYHFLTSDDTTRWLQHLAESRSGTFPQITFEQVADLELGLPPLPIQAGITCFLDILNNKIDLNQRMNKTLESMSKALFKSWFVDFDPVRAKMDGRWRLGQSLPGLPAHFYDLFPDRLVPSELGMIPEGWEVTSLKKIFPNDNEIVLTGPFGSKLHAHDYRPEGVPLILVKHVGYGKIFERELPLVGFHKVSELKRYRLKGGDIVFTRVGAVGRTSYIDSRHEGWLISGQLLRVRVPEGSLVHSRYLAQLYLEQSFIKMVETHALGTTRPSLNTKILRNFDFLLPSRGAQTAFAVIIEPIDKKSQITHKESVTLAALRDTLLPKLISGELRVKKPDRIIGKAG